MRVPVLIVGGGLVGLSASLLLTQHGVPSLLVERRTATSPQPKARRLNFRTMEVYRSLGIAGDVERAGADLANHHAFRVGRTLVDSVELPGVPPGDLSQILAATPVLPCLCAQDSLEPVLRDLAVARGGDVRFGTELVSFDQDTDGVTATLSGPAGRYQVHADYLVAADGARSPVREALGVPRAGRGTLGRALTVYFKADLTEVVRGREFNLCQIEDEETPGAFASVNGTDRWMYLAGEVEVPATDWPRHLARTVGAGDLDVEILSVLPWEPTMRVAERFRVGRVLLAGDAAHVMPPFAAQGANTGIQDVHNLAWKLAAVLAGRAGPGLLDSYQTERHPVAYFAAEQSALRTGDLRTSGGFGGDRPDLAHPFVLTLGYAYVDGALVPDGGPPAPTDRLELTGRPGSRVPHAWLEPGKVSTLDVCGPGFALLVGDEGDDWLKAAERVPFELPTYRVDSLSRGEAMLVRPDAVVAWRSARSTLPTQPAGSTATAVLLEAVDRVLARR